MVVGFKMNRSQLKTIQNSKTCIMPEEFNKKKKFKSIPVFNISPIEHIAQQTGFITMTVYSLFCHKHCYCIPGMEVSLNCG
jgi:hypothetical protein